MCFFYKVVKVLFLGTKDGHGSINFPKPIKLVKEFQDLDDNKFDGITKH